MAIVRSQAGRQLQLLVERLRFFVRTTLQRGGAEFRLDMIVNHLSGRPGLRRRTGNLVKSLRSTVTAPSPDRQRLSVKIGGATKQQAMYATQLERWGRLQFGATWRQHMARILPQLRAGIARIVAGGR